MAVYSKTFADIGRMKRAQYRGKVNQQRGSMAHRIIGDIAEGSIVKVFEPHKYSFERYRVTDVQLTSSSHIIGFTLMKGVIERQYTIRERINSDEVRATLEDQT